MEGESVRRRRTKGKKMTSTTTVWDRTLWRRRQWGGSGAEGGDGRRGCGEEAVLGATSLDDGVPTYGIYSAAAQARAVLVMARSLQSTLRACRRIRHFILVPT